eukprot:6862768-Pyramimonas_sp.AAC.1
MSARDSQGGCYRETARTWRRHDALQTLKQGEGYRNEYVIESNLADANINIDRLTSTFAKDEDAREMRQ